MLSSTIPLGSQAKTQLLHDWLMLFFTSVFQIEMLQCLGVSIIKRWLKSQILTVTVLHICLPDMWCCSVLGFPSLKGTSSLQALLTCQCWVCMTKCLFVTPCTMQIAIIISGQSDSVTLLFFPAFIHLLANSRKQLHLSNLHSLFFVCFLVIASSALILNCCSSNQQLKGDRTKQITYMHKFLHTLDTQCGVTRKRERERERLRERKTQRERERERERERKRERKRGRDRGWILQIQLKMENNKYMHCYKL